MTGAVRGLVIQVAGWFLLVVGVAALVLPGPGLLCIFAGLALLSSHYAWARRWVDPVRLRALRGAAEGVETWPRVIASTLAAVALAACGVLWIVKPAVPEWWWFSDFWWLPGGAWTGVTQIGSAAIAIALIVYSFRRFHGKPEAVEALERDIDEADEDFSERDEHRAESPERAANGRHRDT